MSTNSNCAFIVKGEVPEIQVWYILEDYHAPKNAWNWMENAQAYGPFASYGEADQHLSDNHANPGGSYMVRYAGGDEVIDARIAEAKAPKTEPYNPWNVFRR